MYRPIQIVVFIAFAFLAGSQVQAAPSSGELIPQIKTTSIEVTYVNPKYLKEITFDVSKNNATHNKARIAWDMVQDLPVELMLVVTVYATNSEYKHEKLLLQEHIPLCAEHPKRHLLGSSIVLPKSKLRDCIKKGKYMREDAGFYRFDLEIPNIQEISNYYYTRYTMMIKNEILTEAKFYAEWGYLNASN